MKYRVTTTEALVIAESDDERLTFPYHWRGFERAYTYASVDRAEPRHERRSGDTWTSERMDLATFTHWMALLEPLSSADHATMEISSLTPDREAAIAWLMVWYCAHPGVAPYRLEDTEDLIDPLTGESLPARMAIYPDGLPAAIRAVLVRDGTYFLSMIALGRMIELGTAPDAPMHVRPIGWRR